MGNNYFPDDFSFINLNNFFDFNNHSLIQFYHRNLAYFIIFYVVILSISIFKNREYNLYKPLKILLFFLSLQVFLGIYTLLSELNIFLASLHQIVSVLLIFSALNLYFFKNFKLLTSKAEQKISIFIFLQNLTSSSNSFF